MKRYEKIFARTVRYMLWVILYKVSVTNALTSVTPWFLSFEFNLDRNDLNFSKRQKPYDKSSYHNTSIHNTSISFLSQLEQEGGWQSASFRGVPALKMLYCF